MTNRLDRRGIIATLGAACLTLTTLACGSPLKQADPGSTRPPDIVLFLADDRPPGPTAT